MYRVNNSLNCMFLFLSFIVQAILTPNKTSSDEQGSGSLLIKPKIGGGH